MGFIVYRITNILNGKLYFGATQQPLKKRWQQHKCNASRKNYRLYKSILKHGVGNFVIEQVSSCESASEMFKLEMRLIQEYKTNNELYGYNESIGGDSSRVGCRLTEDQRNKISAYQKTRFRKPHSQETIQKMSRIAKGRDMSKAVEISASKRRGKPGHNRVKVTLNDGIIFESLSEASKITGVSIPAIHNNLKGLSNKTKAGKWEYYRPRT